MQALSDLDFLLEHHRAPSGLPFFPTYSSAYFSDDQLAIAGEPAPPPRFMLDSRSKRRSRNNLGSSYRTSLLFLHFCTFRRSLFIKYASLETILLDMQMDTLCSSSLMDTSLVGQSRNEIPHFSDKRLASIYCYGGLAPGCLDRISNEILDIWTSKSVSYRQRGAC
jgi:hypothetical protein